MNLRVIIAIVLLSASFCAGWLINGWRRDAEIATIRRDQAQANADAQAVARAKEQSLTKQLNEARNEAAKRETKLRADADRSRTAAGGLRDELAAIRARLPDLAADAVRQYADTLADVFGACTAEYREVAEAADGHSSDTKTLDDAWPK